MPLHNIGEMGMDIRYEGYFLPPTPIEEGRGGSYPSWSPNVGVPALVSYDVTYVITEPKSTKTNPSIYKLNQCLLLFSYRYYVHGTVKKLLLTNRSTDSNWIPPLYLPHP